MQNAAIQKIGIVIFAGLLSALLSMTVQRNSLWRDEYTLWSDTLKKSPQKARVLTGYGIALESLGRYDAALSFFQRALEHDRKEEKARHHLIKLLMAMDRLEEAISLINERGEKFIEHTGFYIMAGSLFERRGDMKAAESYYRKAVEFDPEDPSGYTALGIFFIQNKRSAEAVPFLKKAVEISGSAEAYNNLGIAFEDLGMYRDAAEAYRRAVERAPYAEEPRENLGRLSKKLRRR